MKTISVNRKSQSCKLPLLFYVYGYQVIGSLKHSETIIIKKKSHCDEIDAESSELVHGLSSQKSFMIYYFIYMVDPTIGSLEHKFEQYNQYEEMLVSYSHRNKS